MPADPSTVSHLLPISDKDLIEVLRARGHTCAIVMARKDEGAPKDEWAIC